MNDCHHACEILPGFIVGGTWNLREILALKPDVLVPLDSLTGYIWETGFRGEILYYPIQDMRVLPDDVIRRLVSEILARLDAGKRVAVFCAGGHGRTGYVAACVLAARGISDPVRWLREHYCGFAVESGLQEQAVEKFKADLDAHRQKQAAGADCG